MKAFYYVLALLLPALIFPCVQSAESQPLSIVPVQTQSIAANRVFVGGTVTAHKSVVFSAQIPGRIVNISGEEGDHFSQGDLLVKINDDELLAKRQTALAQYSSA
ncbi:MAG: biotin/lipoyl-binding protein, partial [Gammaproteobacteria bacterium]|nr:biotin/lipoyl-binding protein [Gammaproteobacteria bacterium]